MRPYFEHEKLLLSHNVLSKKELQKLWALNDLNNGKYFTNLHNGVKFSQYVGVIQIGDKTIEILPKVDRSADEASWRDVLVNMLQVSKRFPVSSISSANLNKRPSRIIEIYFDLFVSAVEQLVHGGLIKKYRKESANLNTLKGKLDFNKNLKYNVVHKERFFVDYQVYDKDHILHHILYKGLEVIESFPSGTIFQGRINQLKLALPETSKLFSKHDFDDLHYSRKTESYREAIDIAKLLILNFSPDLQKGRDNMLAILFDMNLLWEDFILRLLKKGLQSDKEYRIQSQARKEFWRSDSGGKIVKPDIVVEKDAQYLVLDTKWKVPHTLKPSDQDLKQMFVYNKLWKAHDSVLLYPKTDNSRLVKGIYSSSGWVKEGLSCSLDFIDVMQFNSVSEKRTFNKEAISLQLANMVKKHFN